MFESKRLAHLFNEWLKRYTENPEQFAHQWQTVQTFLSEQAEGTEPSYGDACIGYLMELDTEMFDATKAAPAPVSV